MKSDNKQLIKAMYERIARKDFRSVFMEGGCCIFAEILHQELRHPLFYSCCEDIDRVSHAFVMEQQMCFDFDGCKPISAIAKAFAEWEDVPPRTLSIARLRAEIRAKEFGDNLEALLYKIAREQFSQNRPKYQSM